MSVINKVLDRLVEMTHDEERNHPDIRIRLHGLSSHLNAMAALNDTHEFLVSMGKREGPVPYPDFDHKEYRAKHAEFAEKDDKEGLESYLKATRAKYNINESQDEDNKVLPLDQSRRTTVPTGAPKPGETAAVHSFEHAWNQKADKDSVKQVNTVGDEHFDSMMNKLDSMRRGLDAKTSAKPKDADTAMRARVRNHMATTSDKLFNQLHASLEGRAFPEHISGVAAEHAKDYELFSEPHTVHTFLARSQAMMAAHDPNHTSTPLSKEITKHLGAVLDHPHYSDAEKNDIRMGQRLGEVEGLRGSATFNRGTTGFD